jgi:phosphopantetheinyl transferase (holo-ACP synthase)
MAGLVGRSAKEALLKVSSTAQKQNVRKLYLDTAEKSCKKYHLSHNYFHKLYIFKIQRSKSLSLSEEQSFQV